MTVKMELTKLEEEVQELMDAVDNKDIDNIVEELSDCYLTLDHLKDLLQKQYKFDNAEISTMKQYKQARTTRRFKEGYYEKQ